MLDAIERDPALFAICAQDCSENDVWVRISAELCRDGELNDERIKILKVDRHYSSKNFASPPKSIDCLVVVKCDSGCFELTLIELKDVSSIARIIPRDILEKFRVTIARFMGEDFAFVFDNPAYEISAIRAWLVSDPFNLSHLPDEVYRRKIGTSRLKVFQSARAFVFRGHLILIEMRRPRPPEPEIQGC